MFFTDSQYFYFNKIRRIDVAPTFPGYLLAYVHESMCYLPTNTYTVVPIKLDHFKFNTFYILVDFDDFLICYRYIISDLNSIFTVLIFIQVS